MTEMVYYYDGSFEGLLCCIFDSYAYKEVPTAIYCDEDDLPTLFAAFLIVLAGLRLVRGEKVLEPDDVVEYVGGEDHD